ncbi:MAG: hypothetical protein J2P49_08615, partial [Methylocapsa sp.]|nr:hypothetical protein [Methylocapsa sp.]
MKGCSRQQNQKSFWRATALAIAFLLGASAPVTGKQTNLTTEADSWSSYPAAAQFALAAGLAASLALAAAFHFFRWRRWAGKEAELFSRLAAMQARLGWA